MTPPADGFPERWREVQRLFHQTLEQAPERRAEFLAEAADSEVLRREVEGLLAAADLAETRISGVIARTLEQAARSRPDAASGERIGPYRILREIGHGGMGTVYLAERADEHYRQQVAVKVARSGLAGRDFLLRLRQERQILAHLEHPNIARLLDGGNTEDEAPYLVMEHIEGEPVDRYCEQAGLSIAARLRLFDQVCSAVQAAHRHLVIHRDLKPNNILITEEGTPKLLDFGIAKLLDPSRLSEPPVATALGVRILTPEYASPEQIRDQPVSTATDVYSLGVLLFRLLTGASPYAVDRRQRRAMERAICEQEVPKPSTVAGRMPAEQTRYFGARSASSLRRRLAGDLDNIVGMALRKEPGRRYSSVERLAEDLRRHLAGLPVRARAATPAYRIRKFLARHRLVASLSAAMILLIGALAIFHTTRLAAERDRSRQAEQQATQIADFLRGLFEHADPSQARGQEVTARELLEQGAARIDSELADQPEVRADLMDLMGTVHQHLGLFEPAEPLIREALEIRRQRFGDEHPEVATSRHHLAAWLHAAGRYEEAEALYRQVLTLRRHLLGDRHGDVAQSLTGLADLLYDLDRLEPAEGLFQQALDIRRQLYGPRHPVVAASLNDLGVVRYARGDAAGAEPLLREALAIRRERFGATHPEVAITLSALGSVSLAQGDGERAEALFEEVLEMRRRLYGPRHPAVATSLNNLGELRRRLGDFAGAIPPLTEALEIVGELQGERHLDYSESLENLALALSSHGDPAAAEPLYRKALAITRELLGEDHRRTTLTQLRLGDALIARGERAAAEEVYRQALSHRRRQFAESPWEITSALVRLGRTLLAGGKAAAAEEFFAEALDLRRQERPEHWLTGEAASWLGACLTAQGRFEEAEPLLVEGLRAVEGARGPEHRKTVQARRRLAELEAARGAQRP